MRFSIKKVNKIIQLMDTKDFITICQGINPKNFTRTRKMHLKKITLTDWWQELNEHDDV
ncbi:MAG: hypothetical protein FWB84_07180 [Candidatus Bathyarchaeota archaeon]|uniref:hypothetical protein n=1 Tax=Candidatus Bathycorpusculum sp. TaxID=2994959 RepID=UPI0028346487|nr:hypothetical protein [Candidatus Termiticorpusculum sp.]MCL2257930.1 hypothetical protein [Candidatus Termiticorpusculum sp.]MCL2291921.1 hypothetical protein [Candidatus Termiticorpusculum sp.]